MSILMISFSKHFSDDNEHASYQEHSSYQERINFLGVFIFPSAILDFGGHFGFVIFFQKTCFLVIFQKNVISGINYMTKYLN